MVEILSAIGTFITVVAITGVALVLLTAIAAGMLLWRAWWLYPVWGWYFVPLGIPEVSFWHFTALLFLVGVITAHPDTKKDDRKDDWTKMASVFVWPVVVWAALNWMR